MRVMIAEDSGLFRQMLADLLGRLGIEITGTADTKDEIVRLVAADPPDAVILDIRLPPQQRDEGVQAALEIRTQHPNVGILVLSHYAETSLALRLFENGAAGIGYLVKDRVQDSSSLRDALERVVAGQAAIDPEVVGRLAQRKRIKDPLEKLTPSERDVLSLMAEGFSNGAIAERLGNSPKTVEKRITSITQKLDLPPSQANERGDINVRVVAVLTYLRNSPAK